MNSVIETWRVAQYTQNVYHLSQQKDSRLSGLVRREMVKGKTEYFDRLGLATAVRKTGRNTPTPNLDIGHSRRALTTNMYEWGTLVDKKDKLQNIHSPENEYAKSARMAMGRSMDDVIIDAMLNYAYTGESGTTQQTLGTGQIIASVKSGAIDKLSVATLLQMKEIFDSNEVDPSLQRYVVLNSNQIRNLLNESEVKSADYNTIRALAMGQIDTFMGFKFIQSERTPLAKTYSDLDSFAYSTTTGLYAGGGTAVGATDQAVIAFCGDGVINGIGMDPVGRIEERSDMSYSMQVYTAMDIGAVRMDEDKVLHVICKA